MSVVDCACGAINKLPLASGAAWFDGYDELLKNNVCPDDTAFIPLGPVGPTAPVLPVEPVEPVEPVDPVAPVLPV